MYGAKNMDSHLDLANETGTTTILESGCVWAIASNVIVGVLITFTECIIVQGSNFVGQGALLPWKTFSS